MAEMDRDSMFRCQPLFFYPDFHTYFYVQYVVVNSDGVVLSLFTSRTYVLFVPFFYKKHRIEKIMSKQCEDERRKL